MKSDIRSPLLSSPVDHVDQDGTGLRDPASLAAKQRRRRAVPKLQTQWDSFSFDTWYRFVAQIVMGRRDGYPQALTNLPRLHRCLDPMQRCLRGFSFCQARLGLQKGDDSSLDRKLLHWHGCSSCRWVVGVCLTKRDDESVNCTRPPLGSCFHFLRIKITDGCEISGAKQSHR